MKKKKMIKEFLEFIDNILEYCDQEDRIVTSFIINIKNEKLKWQEKRK